MHKAFLLAAGVVGRKLHRADTSALLTASAAVAYVYADERLWQRSLPGAAQAASVPIGQKLHHVRGT